MNSWIFHTAGSGEVFRAQFLQQHQRTVICWGKSFSHCRLLIKARSSKQTFNCLSAACEIVGRDTWLQNTSSAIIDFHTEDSNKALSLSDEEAWIGSHLHEEHLETQRCQKAAVEENSIIRVKDISELQWHPVALTRVLFMTEWN